MGRISAAFLMPVLSALMVLPASAQQVFRFQSASRLVLFTVVVEGQRGAVDSLRRGDFTVTDNGKPRTIAVFETRRAAQRGTQPGAALPAGTFSNWRSASAAAAVRDRAIILLDCLNSGWHAAGAHACGLGKAAIAKFLDQLGPEQSVALWALDTQGLKVLSGFTSVKAQLQAALAKYRAYEDPARGTPSDESAAGGAGKAFADLVRKADETREFEVHERSARFTLASLRDIASHVGQVPGRISLIWVTVAPCISGAKVAAALGNGRIAVYPVDARGLLTAGGPPPRSVGSNAFSRFAACSQGRPPGQDNLREIAQETGGIAFMNRNDLASGIRRALEDSRASYILGFYVGANAVDHQFHRLQVRVTERGLHAHYPHGYWARDDAAAASGVDPVLAALRSPAEAEGIAMTAHIVSRTRRRLTLQGTVDLSAVSLHQSGGVHEGTLVFSIAAESAVGTIVRRRTMS
ncbi:MAG: VWA domain-containing protein [Acetobacteraceae bacterium]